jgi:hypothetical protein
MTQVQRKQCADCGTAGLESDPSCWACGARDFVPVGTKTAGERTLAMSGRFDRTIAARMPMRWRSLPPQLPIACAMLAGALLIGLAGYWVGRTSNSAPPQNQTPVVTTARQPVALPPPPAYSTAFSQLPPAVYPVPRSQPIDPAQVTIRSAPGKPKPAPKAPVSGATPPPGPVLPSAISAALAAAPPSNPKPSPPTTRRATDPSAPRLHVEATPAATSTPNVVPTARPNGPPSPVPTSTMSVVNLRNDASIPVEVEVTLEGTRIRQALIAPDSLIPIRLSPGSYQLRVLGRGSSSAQSSLTLSANRTYALLINRRDEEGKSVLGFIEPLEPD